MTKKILNNGWVKGITAIIAGVLLIAGAVKAYTILDERQKIETESRKTLKDEGCMPARKNVTDVAVIETRLKSIDDTQNEMQKDQRSILDGIGRIEEKIK